MEQTLSKGNCVQGGTRGWHGPGQGLAWLRLDEGP